MSLLTAPRVTSSSTMAAAEALFSPETDAAAVALTRAGACSHWEKSWSAGLEPGQLFDTAEPCKALTQLLHKRISTSGKEVFLGKKALVPGCGRAYVSDIYSQ